MGNNLNFFASRNPAKKIRIIDINSGKFFTGSEDNIKTSYIITQFGEKISKVNIVATVVEKFESEERGFSSLIIDDGSAAIRLKVFGDDMKILKPTRTGEVVNIIGKIKNYNGEIYIVPEIVKGIENPNMENMRNLEILKNFSVRKKIINEIRNLKDDVNKEDLENYAKNKYKIDEETLSVILEGKSTEMDYKPKILELIEKMDEGNGVSIGKIFEFLGLDENIIENVIDDLLSSGLIYEPVIGKLKKV